MVRCAFFCYSSRTLCQYYSWSLWAAACISEAQVRGLCLFHPWEEGSLHVCVQEDLWASLLHHILFLKKLSSFSLFCFWGSWVLLPFLGHLPNSYIHEICGRQLCQISWPYPTGTWLLEPWADPSWETTFRSHFTSTLAASRFHYYEESFSLEFG